MFKKKTKDDEPTSSMNLDAIGKGPKRNPMKEVMDRLRVQIAVWRVKWAWTYDKLRAKKLHYALPALVLFPVALFTYTMFFSGKPEPRTVRRTPSRMRTQPPPVEDGWARPQALQPPADAAPPPRPQANVLTPPPPPVEEPPPPPEKPAMRAAPAPPAPRAKATAKAKTKATTKKTAVKGKAKTKPTKASAKAKKPAAKKRTVASKSKSTKSKAKKKKK